ncbi:MAG: succinylglutamate desuccinylase/aspartoacylase family protein [Terriglobia bacterium]
MSSESNDKMHPNDFDPDRFARGGKYAFELQFACEGIDVNIPVLLVRGRKGGNTLSVTAGIHGDEHEGTQTIFDVYSSLNPNDMSGDLLAVPVANPLAFWNGTRTSGADGADLARCFPGDLESGPTRTIAYHLARSIIGRGDFFLDFHSAGIKLLMPTLVGYNAQDSRSRDAAFVFGARVVWAHPDIPAGRTISFASSQGIPWLYTEARGAGRIDPGDLELFTLGLENLMRHLSILPGGVKPVRVDSHLYGDGNTDSSIMASGRGFFIPKVKLLQAVRRGEELGRIVNLRGEAMQIYCAPNDGVVAVIRQAPMVESGAPLFLLTGTLA